MKNNVVKNKSLNLLLKNSKNKTNDNDINYDNILAQNHNINGNYKSIYFFKDELNDKENYSDNIINHFTFKDLDEKENIIKKEKKKKNDSSINNNICKSSNNDLPLKEKKEENHNNISESKDINVINKVENDIYINNSYKIINESKYNNKSKVTICLIPNNNF